MFDSRRLTDVELVRARVRTGGSVGAVAHRVDAQHLLATVSGWSLIMVVKRLAEPEGRSLIAGW